ncbi:MULTISPECIES: hypothetical protein [unclassified Desulfovibrio]|uniref:hypothetical protein n=1 Tax=unclassified Desulfovibrio TaxID=2593640 RepID=UPI0013EE3D03|nr:MULTISPECIES: hypothetical protein [unclassified Desulfovibrio]
MPPERGLPSVPRGLSRDLTLFLQAILRVLSSLCGLGPGTEKTRAVRVSEERAAGTVAAPLSAAAVKTRHIEDGAITSAKLADGSVTEKKLAPSSVTERALAGGAVTGEVLAAECVTPDKLAGVTLATGIEGRAGDGDAVLMGEWYGEPCVSVLGFSVPVGDGGILNVGIKNLREEGGVWVFDAVAHTSDADEETGAQTARTGQILWRASGIRRATDEPAG